RHARTKSRRRLPPTGQPPASSIRRGIMGTQIEALPKSDSPSEAAAKALPHHIVITFTDGHSLSGAKFDIDGISPEQIAVAIYHLSRSANMESDRLMMQAAHERREVADIMGKLAKGGR